jgi:hypothetical protein
MENYYEPKILSSIKYCYECKTNKKLEEFDINKNGQFGRFPICKLCRSIKRKLINNDSIINGEKICVKCKVKKDNSSFSKDKSQNDGLQNYCKDCRRNSSKEWASTLDGFIKKILADLNIYCKKNKLQNNLTLDLVKETYQRQNGLCVLTGLPLTHISYSNKENNEISEFFNISIDRKNLEEDYHKDNIQLIGSMIKRMKGNLTNEKFVEFCKMIFY